MSLHWSILPGDEMVSVSGEGAITRADIERYLAATIRGGAKTYAKLIELTSSCTLALDHDDVDSVARSLVQYGSDAPAAGRVAMVVHSELNLDMAMLLKQRVGARPFSIFLSPMEARAWLQG
ncbi:MAG: hypothetical protein ACHQK9_12875 [Reyranellales bacterium]